MGVTRVKKSKKASKQPEDASKHASRKLEDLKLADSPPDQPTSSEQSPALTDSQDHSAAENEDDDPVFDPSYIEIVNTESKGQAVFAARKIPAGTLVLAETPLIRLTQHEEDLDRSTSSSSTNDSLQSNTSLETQFHALPRPLQKSYLRLFDSQKSSFSRLKSIYYSNCYNLSLPSPSHSPSTTSSPSPTHPPSPGGSCIGLLASRLNHSCLPNLQFSFSEARNLMLFHAIKPIPKGRELTSTYDSVFEVGEQRRRRHMLYYAFRCDCEACEPGENGFWARSDERRRGMVEVKRLVERREREWMVKGEGGEDGGKEVVDALVRLEGLLVKEGLVGLPLADTYRSLACWAERMGDQEGMMRWRGRELEVCTTCLGRSAERVRMLKEALGVVR